MKQLTKEVTKIVKHSGLYGMGYAMSKAVGFFMIPVYTRYLKPQDYGILELLDLIIFFVGILAAGGIQNALFRFYSSYEKEKDKKEVVATALFYFAAASVLFTGLLNIWARDIARQLLGSASYAPYIRIVSFTLLFANLCEVPLAYWRAQERTALYVWVGFARTILGASTLATALVLMHKGVAGAIWANMLSNLIAGVALTGIVLQSVPMRLAGGKLKEMLKFGLPLIPWSVGSFVLTFSDRFFLRKFGTLSDVGVYSLGYKIGQIVTLLITGPFSMVWQWQQYEVSKQEEARQMHAKILTYLLFVSLFVGLGMSVFTRTTLELLVPTAYWAAALIAPIIMLSTVMGNVRNVILSGNYIKRTTHQLAIISTVGALFSLAVNYVLIQRYLAMGAAVATLLSQAAILLVGYFFTRRVYPVPYEYGRCLTAVSLAIGLYLLSTLNHLPLLASIPVNLLLVLLAVPAGLLLLDREERKMFAQLGRSMQDYARRLMARPRTPAATVGVAPDLDA